MAWQAPISTTSAGIVVSLGTTDDVFVGPTVQIVSTISATIDGTGSGHEALIYGTVVSTTFIAILLGDNFSIDSGHLVDVKPGGHVQSFGAGWSAVWTFGFNSQVVNEGLLSAPLGVGVRMDGENAGTQSRLVNSGTIEGGDGILREGTEKLVFVNSGTVRADNLAYDGGDGIDQITNTGTLIGETHLGAGNDIYTGTNGRAVGLIRGEDGNDTIRGGSNNDLLYGGFDNDKLYGNAGNDRIEGDAGNDQLYGGVGNDKLYGWENNDQLYGGAGNDKLYGGLGNDKFYGGTGTDRAYFDGNKGAYTIKTVGNKTTVKGPDGNDQLFDVEFLVFDNGTIAV